MDTLTADKLAEVLGEPNLPLLRNVIRILGHDRCAAVLVDALQIEAAEGMRTKDGTRRRTPGGVFFQLVRERATEQERWRLFPRPAPQQDQGQPTALTWEEASSLMQTLATEPPGKARTMKLTLIGSPGKVETRGQAVVFRMQGKPPGALPRGLPPMPSTPALTWNVMVARRQWNRVKESLAGNPDDQLIIEGYPMMQGSEHVLLAQSCTSVALQRAQKQAQQAQPETPTT